MTDPTQSSIAVVDDDYRMLESLESLLESAGHRVRLFSSGQAFLAAGVLDEIDCLISDISMPDIDGFALLRTARQDRPGLPVILITGREEMINTRVIQDLETDRFFTKPFDGRKLLAAIARAVKECA